MEEFKKTTNNNDLYSISSDLYEFAKKFQENIPEYPDPNDILEIIDLKK